VRIIVGEAKFRGTPSKAAIDEMIDGLQRSHSGGLPVSLPFVSEMLCSDGKPDLGEKVLSCAELFVNNKLDIDYVGLLLSNTNASAHMQRSVNSQLHNLHVISLGVSKPEILVRRAFDELEGEL
jgi:hypothetical protein